jgi:hypothetical protein
MIDSALAGMDEAALVRQPSEQCNPAAWILWHLSRVMDTAVHTRIRQVPQLWVSEGWHAKFGMSDDAEDRGVGWTAEQVAEWQAPDREVLLGYYANIKAAVTEFLSSATEAELEQTVVWPPVAEPRTVAAAFGQVTWDAIAHGGQIAYLRGLYLGMGWHR